MTNEPAADPVSRKLVWLADKYDVVFRALAASVAQLDEGMLSTFFPERNNKVRNHALHVVAIADGGYLSHVRGSFTAEDMFRFPSEEELALDGRPDAPSINVYGNELAGRLLSGDEIIAHAHLVRTRIGALLRADDSRARRVVQSHYGGEVPVYEVMYILLRHSAHHLRQLQWFMHDRLGLTISEPMSADDWDGIPVPEKLFIDAS